MMMMASYFRKSRRTKATLNTEAAIFKTRSFRITTSLCSCWVLINVSLFGAANGIQWLSLGKILSVGTESRQTIWCDHRSLLTREQKRFCHRNFATMQSVARGAEMAVLECQNQFDKERWNCSQPYKRRHKRGADDRGGVLGGTREAAYIYALSSAAVSYAVTRDCSSGRIDSCGCDKTWKQNAPKNVDFNWGGCSENIAWGEAVSRQFTDSQEVLSQSRRPWRRKRRLRKRATNEMSVNLNNNKFGRESVAKSMDTKCKCHGLSASCEVITCWRTLPSFAEVGKILKQNYRNAEQVHVVHDRDRRTLKPKGHSQKHVLGLAFLRKSPTFCRTQGRRCNSTSSGVDSCTNLCCGRGYATKERFITENCNCKFKWCCDVSCDVCNRTALEHFCN